MKYLECVKPVKMKYLEHKMNNENYNCPTLMPFPFIYNYEFPGVNIHNMSFEWRVCTRSQLYAKQMGWG